MGLLTGKELKTRKKKVNPPSVKKQRVVVPEKKKPLRIFEYLLFHPENPSTGYINTRYDTVIDGKKEVINIQNGQVRTVMKNIADYLTSKGYELINTKEITNA